MRIALNGYGRIGRSFLRALVEREARGEAPAVELVAINDLGRAEDLLYLTRYDTTHGPLTVPSALEDGRLCVGQQRATLLSEEEPGELPWKDMKVDLVLECTGVFRGHDQAARHLDAGAKRVIIGAVPFDEADAVTLFGVNHENLNDKARVLSAGSCTTHCIAPLLKMAHEEWGVEQVLMKEVHAYTSDQTLLDHVHRDPRRGRAGAQNVIPTTSSAIGAVQKVLPFLEGRISGDSIRVPTLNVAMVDLTLRLKDRTPTVDQVNDYFRRRSEQQPWLLGYNEELLVSADFYRRPESAIFDATQTRVQGDMVRLVGWYDNEWGYAMRLLDLVAWLAGEKGRTSDV
jgi:glyceraldehyde 3-phosphate dehydrogenase